MNAKWTAAALVVLALILVAGWFFLRGGDDRYSDDPMVAKAQKEFAQLVEDQDQPIDHSDNGPVTMEISSEELGESLENLDEEQQQEFAQGLMPSITRMMQKRFERVLNLPPDQQRAELDRIIDQQRSQREHIQEMLKENEGAEQQSIAVDRNTEEGERWMMDNLSLEQRATMDEYVKLLKARLKERGMDTENVPITMAVSVGDPE